MRETTADETTGPDRAGAADWLVLALVTAVGAALRLHFLDQPMRADEAYTYTEYASHTAFDAISLYTFPNNHLLHTLLVHVSVGLFGAAPWAVRLPALLAGVALIPAIAALVWRLGGGRAGLLAAALVAASEPLVSYSANARGYTLLALITVATAHVAHRLGSGGRPADWLLFVVLPALGFFTIPVMLYPTAGLVVWVVLRRLSGRAPGPRLDRLLAALAAGAVLTIALYAPTFFRTGVASVFANPFVRPRPSGDVLRDLPASLAQVGRQWHQDVPLPVTLAFVVSWAVAVVVPSGVRGGVRSLTGLTLTLFAVTLALVVAQRVIPFDRVWLFLLPLYLATVAAGVAAVAERCLGARTRRSRVAGRVGPVVVAVALGLLVARSPAIPLEASKLTLNDGDALVRRMARSLRRGDAVVVEFPCDGPLRYYLLVNGLPVRLLHDYEVELALRLFVVVDHPNGQTPESVLAANHIFYGGRRPVLVAEFGRSALYLVDLYGEN